MSITKIDWTDYSLNPGIYGCSPAHSGCRNCYAATMAHRLAGMGQHQYDMLTFPAGSGARNWNGVVRVDFDAIAPAFAKLPKRKPARVFVTSMGDLFHELVPITFIERVFREMAARPHLTFQVLTKRPHRVNASLPGDWWAVNKPNIWIGASCSTQADVDRMVPDLLRVPAKVRFLSLEPLLWKVSIPHWFDELTSATDMGGISWVIVGCESGPQRRPCSEEWVRSVVEQCRAAGVPCFVKQLQIGPDRRVSRDPDEWPEDLRVGEFPS